MKHKLLFMMVLTALVGVPQSRAEESRPKIGLVLGGGGALGYAHIGVLKVLEEEQIPIDYIGGTSMGAIVAGMYASGMSPEEMEAHFTSLNWWEVLKDQSPHQYLEYRKKVDSQRFMAAEFGLQDWKLVYSPGMAYGQKLNNVLETFAINSVGISDFDQLNIPYRAVAVDLRTGKPVALDSGNLAQAMRASMAVPGAFTPVRKDGMVLVDGGILNNIPVDVVKGMGADIIIAVDVGATSAAKAEQGDFNSLGEVAARTYSLMQRPDQEKQLERADIVIAPHLPDASASQFHLAHKIIPRGRLAAMELTETLSSLSVDEATFGAYLEKQRLKHNEQINITGISITGNKAVSETVIRNRIKSTTGPLQLDSVYADLNRIYGMGDFQTVTYNLRPNDDGHELEYNTAEKFWGPSYLHFGLKLEATSDSSTTWGILVNYTRAHLNSLGGEARIDVEAGGRKRMAFGEWYQPIRVDGRFFIAPSIGHIHEEVDVYDNGDDIADVDQQLSTGVLEAGVSGFEYGEFRIGILGGYATANGTSGAITQPEIDDVIVAGTTRLRLDQLDDPIFPTKGYQLHLDGLFAMDELGSDETFSKLEARVLAPLTVGRHTVAPIIALGSSLGTDLPFYALFDLGGLDSFAGLAPYQLRGNYYGVGSLDYRYRLGRLPPTFGNGIYALLRLDTGNAWIDPDDAGLDDLEYGALVGLGADSILGACKLALGKAEGNNLRVYFTIGNTF